MEKKKDLNKIDITFSNMALSDFVGAIGFGLMATGATLLPEMVTPYVLGSFVLSFFVKWLFEKIWKLLLSLKLFGFYFICFISGIFIIISLKIFSVAGINLWLIINGGLWACLALMLVKSFGDRIYYGN